jgi:serine/threonine protein kinase
MSSTDDVLFGKIALNMHLIGRDMLEKALQYQKAQAPMVPLGELLLQKGVLNREQIERVLDFQRRVKQTITRPGEGTPRGPGQENGGLVDSWQQYAPGTPGSSTNALPPTSRMPGLTDSGNGRAYPPSPMQASYGSSPPGTLPPYQQQAPQQQQGAPADGADNLINQYIGGCLIVAKIGEGGMGAIYRARHEALRKDVVVKILPPESAANERTVKRFFREAQAAAKLEHPNIVQVLNVGTTDRGLHFIIMQYIDGKNLEDTIQEKGKHPWKEAVRIVIEIGRGLQAAHAAGVIHRDIKADNILITTQGVVKLADFGLAKDLNSDMKLTADGAMIGTPLYMAPEIGRVKEIDGRVDIYSLGVTFYYLLTGIQPFRAFPAIEILSAKAHDRLKPPEQLVPDIPAPVRNVLGKMLEKDREQRYKDCDTLLRELEALDRGFPVDAGVPALWGEIGSIKPEAPGTASSGTRKTSKRVNASSSSRRGVPVARSGSKLNVPAAAPPSGIPKGLLIGIIFFFALVVALTIVVVLILLKK